MDSNRTGSHATGGYTPVSCICDDTGAAKPAADPKLGDYAPLPPPGLSLDSTHVSRTDIDSRSSSTNHAATNPNVSMCRGVDATQQSLDGQGG